MIKTRPKENSSEFKKITSYPAIGQLTDSHNVENIVLFYAEGKGIGLTGIYENKHVIDFNMDEFYLYPYEVNIKNMV